MFSDRANKKSPSLAINVVRNFWQLDFYESLSTVCQDEMFLFQSDTLAVIKDDFGTALQDANNVLRLRFVKH